MSNSLATRDISSIAQRVGKDAAEIEFISKKYCNGAPPIEVEHFIRYAQSHGLDISAKHAYLIPRKNYKTGEITYTIQIAIDGFRAIAEATGQYDGQDEPEFQYGKNGEIVAATVRVYRKGMSRPIAATAFFREYADERSPMWTKMPHGQISKCAEALALRKAFPTRLGGSYVAEEMDQAGPVIEHHTAPPKAEPVRLEHAPPQHEESKQEPPQQAPRPVDPDYAQALKTVCGLLGITRGCPQADTDDAFATIAGVLKMPVAPSKWAELTVDDLRDFILKYETMGGDESSLSEVEPELLEA